MLRLIAPIILFAGLIWPAQAADAPQGPVVLTVAGAVAHSNREAFDPFHDAFTNYHERSFDKAVAFDLTMLRNLPQAEVRTFKDGWPGEVTAEGPRLSDVLTAAGVADDATITVVGLDGYAVEIVPDQRAAHDWIVAHTANGTPLGVGGRGPLWTLYGSGGEPVSAEVEGTWVWAVYFIEVN